MSRRRVRRLQWAILIVAVGCGGADSAPTAAGVTTTQNPALHVISVTLTSSSLQVGQTATATATGTDQNGAAIATGTVTWTSSSPAVASLNSSGTVTALSAGTTTIIASAGGLSGQTPLTVTAATQSGSTSASLAAAGQSTAFLDSPNPNVALTVAANAQYLIAVVNTDATYTSREDFTLAGSFGASASSSVASALGAGAITARAAVPSATIVVSARHTIDPTTAAEHSANHLGVLDDNRRIFSSFGNPRAAWASVAASRGRSAPISAAIVPSIGTVNKVYVKNALSGLCTAVDSIGARTVAVGQHVIVLADTNTRTWPQAYRPDSSFYQTFANEYDQVTWPHLINYIGDPLAYDASLSNAGKVTVTITPVLNNFAGGTGGGSVVAFVNGCDFFPFAATGANADRSNQTEMFYSWTPSANGDDIITWEKGLRGTAAHESKHLVSYADRIINDSPDFEEVWLEEGLAQESSEIWERNFNQATWKGNATFAQTVACEINLGANAPCDLTNDRPQTLVDGHLPFFFSYLQTESSSHSEGLGLDTPADYGAGWTISRWATDQYASTEGAFIKSLINEPTLTGVANLSRHTGQSNATLLVYWNLATAIFQTPAYTIADVRATIPSFNFADIFKAGQTGLTCSGKPCGLFTSSGTPVFPIQPVPLTAGTISNAVTGVPGTSAVFYLLTASGAGTETLQLLSSSGLALSASSGFRMAILRVR